MRDAVAITPRTLAAAMLSLLLALMGATGHRAEAHGVHVPGAGQAPAHHAAAHAPPGAGVHDLCPTGEAPAPHAPGHGDCPLCVLAHALPAAPFAGVERPLEPGVVRRPAMRPAPHTPLRPDRATPARGPPLLLIV